MSTLFSPIDLRGLKLSNRIMVSPMCQYSAEGGSATDWHFTHINIAGAVGRGDVLHRGHRMSRISGGSRRAASASTTTPPRRR